MVEGKAMRMVEVTTHFTTPLTEEETKCLREKMRMVSDLVAVKRRAEGFGLWNIEVAIDTQVCQNEIIWRVFKVVRGATGAKVSKELGTQATVVYGEDRMKGAWVTNRKAIVVFVWGLTLLYRVTNYHGDTKHPKYPCTGTTKEASKGHSACPWQ